MIDFGECVWVLTVLWIREWPCISLTHQACAGLASSEMVEPLVVFLL